MLVVSRFENVKKTIGIITAIVLLVGCRPTGVTVKPTITVSCSPTTLASNQWATLTIFQIYKPGEKVITLNEGKLGQVALYANRTEISDPNEDGSGYSLRIYSVKPIGTNAVTIDGSFFPNASTGLRPVIFQGEPAVQ